MTTTVQAHEPVQAQESAMTSRHSSGAQLGRALLPLVIDVAVPLAIYFIARAVLGASLIDALVLSSVVPVVRIVVEAWQARAFNPVAVLMLGVNLAGIAVTFFTGNVRLGTAKSAVIGAVLAIGFLVSVARRRPVLSEAMRPFITRGADDRAAAWDHLHGTSVRFRTLENRFTLVYGCVFLTESLARVAVAFLAPVSVLGWLPNVLLFAGIAAAVIVSGGAAADPITKLVDTEVGAACLTADGTQA